MSTSMQADEIRELRLTSSEAYGDGYFDDPAVQQSLLFEKRGDVIFDKAGNLNLEYRYPSTIGTALFFHGAFEGGEADFAAAVLRQSTAPIVIDAGANIGLHIVAWAEAVPALRGYAFEPVAANVELLETNLRSHSLLDRVRVERSVLGAAVGSVVLHETDDAAYSSIIDTGRRKIVASYDVPATTVDDYVASNAIAQLDLLKIDVEGYEDAVLEGAQRSIATHRPHLFVEISAENHNTDPEATIARLKDIGYTPYVISDGIVTECERHDDRFYNYFFIHESRPVVLPQPNLRQVRRSVGLYADLIRRQRVGVLQMRADLDAKDLEVRRLRTAAEERLNLIRRLQSVSRNAGAQIAERSHETDERVEAMETELLQSGQLAEGRLRLVETLREENAALAARCEGLESDRHLKAGLLASLESQVKQLSEALAATGEAQTLREHLRKKEEVIQGLKTTVDEQREHIGRFQKAANERLGIIERFDAHVAFLREQLEFLNRRTEDEQKAAQERGRRIMELTQSLDERNRQLEELRGAFESTKMDATAKDLLINKLDEFLKSQRDEAVEMRKVAEERLAVIEQLDELARERLEVIRSLNERLNAV
ncbi:MAG TPA: FkbM family methyltransferase [Candidatus Rubrimentiphilum sp.]|nr:FkbM family methyltransferase [Candidatus Rubrimentiphilum sp.]